MTISVVIPVYNGSRTIRTTLDSVLQQTLPPDEILVMDDGSTDDTFSILESYKPRVLVFRQENKGVAATRNALVCRAKGALVAFLDSDDVWHPRYLEHQCMVARTHPHAVAYFTGHVDFYGYGNYEWDNKTLDIEPQVEVIDPLTFFKSLDLKTGFFFPSFLCVPKTAIANLGREPFREHLSGVDDTYFCCRLALLGHVIFARPTLVAYRVHEGSISANILKMRRLAIACYEALEEHYRLPREERLFKAFEMTFASVRRQYAKQLMGVGGTREARRQIFKSLSISNHPVSLSKSLGLLLLSYMPAALQPTWPLPLRESKPSAQALRKNGTTTSPEIR